MKRDTEKNTHICEKMNFFFIHHHKNLDHQAYNTHSIDLTKTKENFILWHFFFRMQNK